MAIYLAADEPLPLLNDHPGAVFYTAELRDKNDEAVRQHFTKRYVVYVGSFEGCGCGFFKLEHAEYAEPEEVESRRSSLSALAAYLSDALRQCGAVELFSVGREIRRNRQVTVASSLLRKSQRGL